MKKYKRLALVLCLFLLPAVISGCAGRRQLERLNEKQAQMIYSLSDEVNRLNNEVAFLAKSKDRLKKTQLLLQQRLKEELAKGDLTVDMSEKGLVVTVLNKILFDSGKTALKNSSKTTLEKVGGVLRSDVPDQLIFVEGHTDNDPIKHSGYKSNWELSVLRATEVVHYFTDVIGINPKRIVASGYGEFQPIASNETRDGKAMNRRVEIIISPKKFIKQPFGATDGYSAAGEQDGM